MSEQPIYFGEGANLLGVLTIPAAARPDSPAVILLNAGLLHRVGPNRLHVDIARRLAVAGFATLRFDMSGVGDSELDGANSLLYIERSVHDVNEAMDALESTHDAGFVLMGLCTGAYNAFRVALADERVRGCVLLDGYSYPTLRSNVRHYAPRVFQLDRWKGYVKRKVGAGSVEAGAEDLIVFENEYVSRERFGAELASLVERRVQFLMIYTALGPLAYYYESQLEEAFPDIEFDPHVTVRFYPDADHTFMMPGHRERLLTEVESWMTNTFTGVLER